MEYVVTNVTASERGFTCFDSAAAYVSRIEETGVTSAEIWSVDSDGNWEQVA